MSKVWIITGCSTGFGRELAKQTLAKGYKVAVTARNLNDIQDIVADYSDTSIALQLDVTKSQEIKAAVEQVNQKFGQIDVLVNNAGIGYFGAIEESEDKEVRRMFEINYFGLVDMTNKVLPTMRKQRSGHIINIASIAGLVGFPAVGHYNATKFAVDGVSESLSKELAPLGIKVTIISPSGFRTDWAGRSANEATETIDDYKQTAEANKNNIRNASGNQAGDPVRGAEAIIKVTEVENPPLHLLLGNAALNLAREKLNVLKKDYDAWEETTVWADNPKE
jgi:NAD(P)-dependent dehydrogenase (short-subunit alcohol dehydrogenase family)